MRQRWLHHIRCLKCGDPTGLRHPRYIEDRDVIALKCVTCKGVSELTPLDTIARFRRDRWIAIWRWLSHLITRRRATRSTAITLATRQDVA